MHKSAYEFSWASKSVPSSSYIFHREHLVLVFTSDRKCIFSLPSHCHFFLTVTFFILYFHSSNSIKNLVKYSLILTQIRNTIYPN